MPRRKGRFVVLMPDQDGQLPSFAGALRALPAPSFAYGLVLFCLIVHGLQPGRLVLVEGGWSPFLTSLSLVAVGWRSRVSSLLTTALATASATVLAPRSMIITALSSAHSTTVVPTTSSSPTASPVVLMPAAVPRVAAMAGLAAPVSTSADHDVCTPGISVGAGRLPSRSPRRLPFALSRVRVVGLAGSGLALAVPMFLGSGLAAGTAVALTAGMPRGAGPVLPVIMVSSTAALSFAAARSFIPVCTPSCGSRTTKRFGSLLDRCGDGRCAREHLSVGTGQVGSRAPTADTTATTHRVRS